MTSTTTDRRSGVSTPGAASDRLTGVSGAAAYKAPCKVATTANISLSGLQTIDGVTLVADDRVLAKDQTTASQNGAYIASSGNWSRASDWDDSRDVVEGTRVWVTDGTLNGQSEFVVTSAGPITPGTTSVTIEASNSIAGGAMLAANNLSDVASPIAALKNLMSNGADIVCANPLVLNGATGDMVDVTGNTSFSAVTLAEGKSQWVRFTGTPTITVGASLIGNNNAGNLTIEAGDVVLFRGYAAGVVRFVHFPIRARFSDASFRVVGGADKTKQFAIETDGFTTGQTRTMTPPDADFIPAALNVADQTVTGGVRVTSSSLGTITTGTLTLDPGDRPLQHYTNGGAHTLAPGANTGSILLDITNNASAGAITTSGWTKVVGAFTTTNADKFRCSASVGSAGSLLTIQAMQ